MGRFTGAGAAMTKRELLARIEALEQEDDLDSAAISALARRVQALEEHVKALDQETHAPVRPETWRQINPDDWINATAPHTNSTYCPCNKCQKGVRGAK